MHGRVKVKSTAQQMEEKRIEREKKMKMYKMAMGAIFKKRSAGQLDEEMLQYTASVLQGNPDDATLWNIRREVFLKFKQDGINVNDRTKDELFLTQQALMKNPKSYGAWWHRGWVNLNLPDVPDWKNELKLCGLFLEKDDRNFHCWDYRRFVCGHCDVSLKEELQFSRDRIDSNFSNYSSWHYRSHLLPRIFPGKIEDGERIEESVLLEELDLVINAAFTDPHDQSAWMYHRWLLGRANPEGTLTFLSWSGADGEIFATFASPVSSCDLSVNAAGTSLPNWVPLDNPKSSAVWTLSSEALMDCDILEVFGYGVNVKLTKDNPTWNGIKSHGDTKISLFQKEVSAAKNEVLRDQLDNVSQLVEMEPDCKWPVLTNAMLMKALDAKKYNNEISDALLSLNEIDPKRINYYNDLRSKFTLEAVIDEKFGAKHVDLSKLQLTCLRHTHLLCCVEELNLSYNNLKSENLSILRLCPRLKVLILDSNTQIENLDFIKDLRKIERLSLAGCEIVDITALASAPPSLKTLILTESTKNTLADSISKFSSKIEVIVS